MIRIGIVSEHRCTISGRPWECESFTISPTTLTFRQIFDSAFATPARYVLEIVRRLRVLGTGRPESLFVFNPLFQLGQLEIWLVLAELDPQEVLDAVVIVEDRDGRPLGYGFPPDIADSEAIALLSTVDAGLDAQLCERLFTQQITRIVIGNVRVARAQHNGFIFEENEPIYRWIASRAVSVMAAGSLLPSQEMACTAIMPHHAGDVLFFALAWRFTATQVSGLAVNSVYQPIVADISPELASLPLDIPPINRSEEFAQGKVMKEGEYFPTIAAALPANCCYQYLRPSRDYNVSRFHLIDHFAFALGRNFWHADDLLTQQRPLPQPLRQRATLVRVLLFFDGGWPLKIYPRTQQQQLIDLLNQRGFEVTVLAGARQEYRHCTVVRFESYAQLKSLLSKQHLMVGMDSFPTHLAAHILGLPTLCLFGSTRPENSNAPEAPHYRHLENGLSCRPCYGIVTCPLYGGGNCANFAPPDRVAEAIGEMLCAIGVTTQRHGSAAARYTDSPAIPEWDARPPHYLTFGHRAIRAPLYALAVRLTPSFGLLSQVRSEFMVSLRRDGWRQTYLRILRFLKRTLRRRFSH
jgi:hypothetical protein